MKQTKQKPSGQFKKLSIKAVEEGIDRSVRSDIRALSLSGAITLDWPTRNAQSNKIMREAPTRSKTRVDQPIAVDYYLLGPLPKDNCH